LFACPFIGQAQNCKIGSKVFPNKECAEKLSDLADLGAVEMHATISGDDDTLMEVLDVANRFENVKISGDLQMALKGGAAEFINTLYDRAKSGKEKGWYIGSNVGAAAGKLTGVAVGGLTGVQGGLGAGLGVGATVTVPLCMALAGPAFSACMVHLWFAGGVGAGIGAAGGIYLGMSAGKYLGEKVGGVAGATAGVATGTAHALLTGLVFEFGPGLWLAVKNQHGLPEYHVKILPQYENSSLVESTIADEGDDVEPPDAAAERKTQPQPRNDEL